MRCTVFYAFRYVKLHYAYETSVEFHVVDLQIMWRGRSSAEEPSNLLGDFSSPSHPVRYMLVITCGALSLA